MFTPVEEKQIIGLNDQLSGDITISLLESTHPSSPKFRKFCGTLTRLVPKIKISKINETDSQLPQILIGSGLRFQAVPAGLELQPFLETIAAVESGLYNIGEADKAGLKKDGLPAFLKLFMAPQCTFCPTAVRQLTPLPIANERIQLTIIDATLFPEEAQSNKIRAVPTILLDEQFRWTGSVPLQEIINTINSRNPASLGAASLENILKQGQASRVAGMMLDAGQIFPAFYDLLIHPKWPVRLGAMVVVEEIAGRSPALAAEVINILWERFYRQPDQVKGDILYLFGEIGDRRTAAWLEAVLAEDHREEVKEAAREALEKMPE